jgi:hypothetical protein
MEPIGEHLSLLGRYCRGRGLRSTSRRAAQSRAPNERGCQLSGPERSVNTCPGPIKTRGRSAGGFFFDPVESRTAFFGQGCSTTGTQTRFKNQVFSIVSWGFPMSTLQKHSTTALGTRLLVIVRNLELQLYELNKLRHQVRQAELSVRKSRRTDNGIRERNKRTLRQGPKPRCSVRTEPASRGRSA